MKAAAEVAGASWLDQVGWNEQGLIPVIAQESGSNDVLMVAWMNRDALQKTRELGEAVYWSRSRNRLWHKGEESGHVQTVHEIRLDCDADVILLTVTQTGNAACHTGRHSCFFRSLRSAEQAPDQVQWEIIAPVLKDPGSIYK